MSAPLCARFPLISEAASTRNWWHDLKFVTTLFGELINADFSKVDLGRNWRVCVTPSRPDDTRTSGRAIVAASATLLPGAVLIGDVIISEGCEIGPNCAIFGPTILGPNCYVGPGAEIRRSAIFSHLRMSHMSYLGHSIVGHNVTLAAGFTTAVRNLKRHTVHVKDGDELIDTGHELFGAVIADDFFCRINTEAMPGRVLSAPIL